MEGTGASNEVRENGWRARVARKVNGETVSIKIHDFMPSIARIELGVAKRPKGAS